MELSVGIQSFLLILASHVARPFAHSTFILDPWFIIIAGINERKSCYQDDWDSYSQQYKFAPLFSCAYIWWFRKYHMISLFHARPLPPMTQCMTSLIICNHGYNICTSCLLLIGHNTNINRKSSTLITLFVLLSSLSIVIVIISLVASFIIST